MGIVITVMGMAYFLKHDGYGNDKSSDGYGKSSDGDGKSSDGDGKSSAGDGKSSAGDGNTTVVRTLYGKAVMTMDY